MTRVVAGAHGGRRLRTPRGDATRPTSDRVREALFSTLADRVVDATVLDLFAGSGALGIEALSRGATTVTFVERDHRVAGVLRANLAALGLTATVHTAPVERVVASLAATGCATPFTLVLCDPPYAVGVGAVVARLTNLAEGGCLAPGATIVVERARRSPRVPATGDLWLEDRRTYGDTVLYYLRYRPTLRRGDDDR